METTAPNLKGNLFFELPVPANYNGKFLSEVELLKNNGIAEEVLTKKVQGKSFSWIANIIAITFARLGDVLIAADVRNNYAKTETVVVPSVVTRIPLASANSAIIEIHRRVWKNVLEDQEVICKYCTTSLRTDVNLSEIKMPAKYVEVMKNFETSPMEFIVISLDDADAFSLDAFLSTKKDDVDFSDLMGVKFNQLVFRIPLLADAIKHEKIALDSIKFWRNIACECLVSIKSVGDVTHEFPMEKFVWLGMALFDKYLDSDVLQKVRTALREEPPTLPFTYEGICGCPMQREIPYAIEAKSFFSE